MNRNKYQTAFDEIQFSENFKEQVIDKIRTSKVHVKRANPYVRLAGMLCASCCMVVALIFMYSYKMNDFADKNNEIREAAQVDSVRTVDVNENGMVNHIEILPDAMAVLEYNPHGDAQGKLKIEGTVSGKEVKYDLGYIEENAYHVVEKSDTNVIAGELEQHRQSYWCISNRSANPIIFDCRISIESNDLLFKSYGTDAVQVEKNTHLVIENIDAWIDSNSIRGIYAYFYENNTMTTLQPVDGTIDYKAEKAGHYRIFALTEEGGQMELNDKVHIQSEAQTDIQGEDSRNNDTNGMIGL